MTLTRTFSYCAAACVAAAGFADAAQAGFFVRSLVQIGDTIVDGFDKNDALGIGSGLNGASSSVSLDYGSLQAYVLRSPALPDGTAFAQAAGIFGDRLTFYNGVGTDATFSLDLHGSVLAAAKDGAQTLQYGVYAGLFVFEVGSGATYNNFGSLPGAVIAETFSSTWYNPASAVDEDIDQILSGTITLGPGKYDIFAFLNVSAVLNDNSGPVELDFGNTGQLGIGTPSGVFYSSSSGVFLNSVPSPTPEPASWAMMIGGFALGGAALRRARVRPALRAVRAS